MIVKRFMGKTVLVTGAASGIGRATALRLGSEGAAVALADKNAEGAERMAAEIRSASNVAAHALQFDAADGKSCARMVDEAVARLGRLDVLCNIAGIITGGPFTEIADADWERVIAINLSSLFYVTRQAMPHLVETKGNVVNMASASGLRGVAERVPYSAAKAGVIGFTRSLATEYAPKLVRVNALCPGGIATPPILGALGGKPAPSRLGDPEQIAAAVALIASDEAGFVTGSIMELDGKLMPA
jgi:NAD(P)-dependent dehydrogenase (short-subunit alcohol dehydrogenase family)